MVEAIEDVIKSVKNERCISNSPQHLVLLAMLDIRNTFNSVRLANMLKKLYSTLYYLMRVIRSYLQDRMLLCATNEGLFQKIISSGSAQGSILWLDL